MSNSFYGVIYCKKSYAKDGPLHSKASGRIFVEKKQMCVLYILKRHNDVNVWCVLLKPTKEVSKAMLLSQMIM